MSAWSWSTFSVIEMVSIAITVIRRNRIVWAKPWTDRQIGQGREQDAGDLRRYYLIELPAAKVMARSRLSRNRPPRSQAAGL